VHTGLLIVQAQDSVGVHKNIKCRQMGKGVVSAHRTIDSAGTQDSVSVHKNIKCRQMGKGVVSAHRTIDSAGTQDNC